MTRLIAEADLETPAVDAAEQAVSAIPAWQDEDSDEPPALPLDAASEWDAEEQSRVVDFDDDYR